MSSDLTPAGDLDARLDFVVGEFDAGNAGDELQLTLTNTGTLFNINQIYWNAAASVTALGLLSATHSAEGDVTADWAPVETGFSAGGFGAFDFALTGGVGQLAPGIAGPSESIVFILDITGTATMADFIQPNGLDYIGAAKFVNGPDDPEAPGSEDSAFGATLVPEPGTALLLSLGLLGLAAWRR